MNESLILHFFSFLAVTQHYLCDLLPVELKEKSNQLLFSRYCVLAIFCFSFNTLEKLAQHKTINTFEKQKIPHMVCRKFNVLTIYVCFHYKIY